MTTTTKASAVQRLQLTPFDPWDVGQLSLPESLQAALPELARAPMGWFTLPDAVRAHLAGLAVVVLAEVGPEPGRIQRASSCIGAAHRGTFDPDGVSAGEARDYAARFFVEDPTEREAWRHSFTTLHRIQQTTGTNHTDQIRSMLAKLDGAAGVLATTRARHQQLGAILERLEKAFAGGPAQ